LHWILAMVDLTDLLKTLTPEFGMKRRFNSWKVTCDDRSNYVPSRPGFVWVRASGCIL
jgi:hypothetical protein